jgi:hypothetical protein
MSITSDIRSYADTALEQGKSAVNQAVGQAQAQISQAQAQLNGITGTAKTNVSELTNRAQGAVTDLRTQAEKTLNIDAIKTAVEPYLAQARQYRATVTDRAEELFETVYGTVTRDKRVAKVVATAESFSGVVVETVTERVVKPVASLTGRGSKPATRKAPAKSATKAASTRPAAKKSSATSAAKTAPAKKATAARSTATKSTPRKAAAKKTTATDATS